MNFLVWGIGGVAGYLAGKKLGIWGKKKASPAPSPSPGPSPTPTPQEPADQPPSHPNVSYAYTGEPQDSATIQNWAHQLAASDPYDIQNAWLVRMFEWAVGLTEDTYPGADAVTPAGTDGRYGSDCQAELSKYVSNAPALQSTRPDWWGAPGTYTNPDEPPAPTGMLELAS